MSALRETDYPLVRIDARSSALTKNKCILGVFGLRRAQSSRGCLWFCYSTTENFTSWRNYCPLVPSRFGFKNNHNHRRFDMFRLLRLASYALLGYAVYELIQGVCEGHENSARQEGPQRPARRPLRSNELGRGVIS